MKNWKQILREKKLKATPGRVAFLEALEKSAKPISVERLKDALHVDLATIYRMVDASKKAGLIREIDMRHGHAHYELVDARDHHHAICLSCDAVVEFEYADEKKMIAAAQKQTGFAEIVDHTMEVYGYCKKCSTSSSKR